MKITLPVEAADMLIRSKQLSDKNMNSLIKESMVLLLQKYTDNPTNQHTQSKDQYVQNRKDRPELT